MMNLDGRRIFNFQVVTTVFCIFCLVTIQSVAFADNETSNEQASIKTTDKIYYKNTDLKTIKIFGEAVNVNKGDKITIIITEPNGDRGGSQIFPTEDGYYETFHLVQSNSPLGTYQIDASFRGKVVGTIYFEIAPASEKPVPVVEEKIEPVKEEKPVPVVEEKLKIKPILSFVDQNKDPAHYVERYINEKEYQKWFNEHFSDYKIWEGVGITEQEYRDIVNDLNRIRQESKTQISNSGNSETSYSPYTTSPEDLRNQMGLEEPQTYEQGLSQMYATMQYARDTGQLDQMGSWAREANERARIDGLERWENLPFLEKHWNWIILGSFIAVIGAIIGTVVTILKRKKKPKITLPNVEYSKRARASESSGTGLLLSCRKCNGPVHEDEKFCGKCGSSTIPKPDVRRGIRCENCDNLLKSGEKFCGKCGCPQVPKSTIQTILYNTCKNCNNSLKAKEKFCGKCGSPV